MVNIFKLVVCPLNLLWDIFKKLSEYNITEKSEVHERHLVQFFFAQVEVLREDFGHVLFNWEVILKNCIVKRPCSLSCGYIVASINLNVVFPGICLFHIVVQWNVDKAIHS